MDATATNLFVGLAFAIVICFVFFSVRHEWRTSHARCVCTHFPGQHVRKMDTDSEWYYPGNDKAENKIGYCRTCRGKCRVYIRDLRV